MGISILLLLLLFPYRMKIRNIEINRPGVHGSYTIFVVRFKFSILFSSVLFSPIVFAAAIAFVPLVKHNGMLVKRIHNTVVLINKIENDPV